MPLDKRLMNHTFRYRSVWISDTHLGMRGCRAAELSRFLKHLRCENLYLVGDIIDMWRLRSKWCWPAAHNDVCRRLLNHARHGTRVVFVPGNHDEAMRQFTRMSFGGIDVQPLAVHVGADGRKLLVIHGDQFDLVVRHSRLVSMLGAWAYERLISVNGLYNGVRRRLNLPYRSLSQAIKLRVKSACTFISRFEEVLVREAQRRGFDGVVCGHIHKAEHREGPVAYYNCGDWVEGCTAVVEHLDGTMEVIDVLPLLAELDAPTETLPGYAELVRWNDAELEEADVLLAGV